ncbi:hypothetical protein MesoLjLb_09220 [Mesorhizobium sp. L-8-3]|nr:hypothetical protein MesoLjLb_09220 [Mesorhizobium sp. L-8-3]
MPKGPGKARDPGVRDGDALADARRAQFFAGMKRVEDLMFGQAERLPGPLRQELQHLQLRRRGEIGDDVPRLEEFR